MKSLTSCFRLRLARPRALTWVALPFVATILALSFAANTGTAPAIKAIALASEPLYATTSGDKPTLALALSVEYPTVGAQYTPGGESDNTYSNLTEYIGYYDAYACYVYNDAPSETIASGLTKADYKRFDRILTSTRTDRMCADGFSGNFLNWATNSAIDMLRLALSGGDRYIDKTDLTVLQRAVVPNGDPICMWNSTNFPAKQLLRSGGGNGKYWGAVPQKMVTAAGSNDIWVANTLNQVYFGTARGGGCDDTSSYALGVVSRARAIGPITSRSSGRPNGTWTTCAYEGGTCRFNGVMEVWYGTDSSWKVAPASNDIACTNEVFGDPKPGYAKACYMRAYSGTWKPPASTAGGLSSDSFFFSRVKVCDKDSAGKLADARNYTFCTKYPSGSYKPTGVVQKYSDQLRLAAFGYLLDQTNSASTPPGRYGGVLRAPMKYVGAKTFDINGNENTQAGGNPAAEWNATTGIYAVNPDAGSLTGTNAGFGMSGVINYLNKFGRTGSVAGRYKNYDPVSELYYETLRYLQGLQPSTNATSGITSDMYDGYPAFTAWADPYGNGRSRTGSYACLKSNIVVIGDINTHDGNRFPDTDAAHNIPDLNLWTGIVNNFETGADTTYQDGQNVLQHTTGNPNTGGGSRTDAIIGYSYWAHTHDIRGSEWTDQPTMQRPGLRVKSFLFDVNEFGDQNNANTRRNYNQFFTSAKYGGFESDPANAGSKPFNTFGNPFRGQDGAVDPNVWQDNANPGEASTYYLQSSARGVLRAFDSIFSRASTSARSIAGSAVQSKSLQTSSAVYQGAFDTSDWSGDLVSLPLTIGGTTVTTSATPSWSASARLALLSAPATSRHIVIGRPGGGALPVATDFSWSALSPEQQANLNQGSPSAAPDGLGQDRLAYLRGDSAKEGSPFRGRNNKLLGDIINSGVAYSGAPSENISSDTYATFKRTNTNRTKAVFVGANDGMLHAFNADTGDELFGYVPSWLAPRLSALTDPNYVSSHQSYVDGPPVVAEAQVGSTDTAANWKTVLVSGTGAGGRGVFALDVTDPSVFSAANVMWEFTQNDDVDMGYVVGQPQILKMRTSPTTAATPTYKWFAVVASGVNNYTTTNTAGNYSTGNPALFLLDLSKPSATAWTMGVNYYKVSLPFDAALAVTNATGVLNFKAVLDIGSSRAVTKIFAGDLHGNMWKLDFNAHGADEWNMTTLSAFVTTGNVPYPLFIAKDDLGNVQPISMAPTLVASTLNTNSIQVAFGTGKYLEIDDRSSSAKNSFYVVYDNGTSVADAAPPGASAVSGRARLKAGSIDAATGDITVPAFSWGRPTTDVTTTSSISSGWYLDYLSSGERQVSGALLSGSTLVFSSLIPGASADAAACGVSGGGGNLYAIDVDTGVGTRRVSTVGIMGMPLVIDLASASYTVSNSTGRRVKTITSQVITQGASGISTGSGQTTRTMTAGRLSWRQINNYLDLRR
jgi:type IV pilus assembly protein PilY1